MSQNRSTNKKYYLYEMRGITLNIIAALVLIGMIILTLIIDSDFKDKISFDIALIFIIPYLILHELLHGFSYVLHGADFKNITFGVHLEKSILCCLCKQNVTRKNILMTLLYPFIIIGVITYIFGMIFNNYILVILSIINISGCVGDLIMFTCLVRLKDFEYSEYDNPMAFGLYSDNDLSNIKLFGLKYVGDISELEKNDLRKVTISKVSIIIIVLLILLGIVNILI